MNREVVRTLVERIPEQVLRRTVIRNKRALFKEEVEHLGLDQDSGGRNQEEMARKIIFPGIRKIGMMVRRRVTMSKTVFAQN